MARLEEALADVLGHKMPAAEQPGSQYQSAEQLTDIDHHQSISRQISAIMELQRHANTRNAKLNGVQIREMQSRKLKELPVLSRL